MKLTKELVGIRYGKALYEVAAEQHATELVFEQLQVLKEVFLDIPDLGQLLTDVRLKPSDKQVIFNDLYQSFTGIVGDFLKVVFQAERMDDMLYMIDEYNHLYNKEHGILKGTITTAVPLSEGQKEQVEAKVASLLGYQTAQLDEIIDPSIIGGLLISADNRVIDMTLKHRLELMTRCLTA